MFKEMKRKSYCMWELNQSLVLTHGVIQQLPCALPAGGDFGWSRGWGGRRGGGGSGGGGGRGGGGGGGRRREGLSQ